MKTLTLRTLPAFDDAILLEHGGDSESTLLDARTLTNPQFIYEDNGGCGSPDCESCAQTYIKSEDLPLDVQIVEKTYYQLSDEELAALRYGMAKLALDRADKAGQRCAKTLAEAVEAHDKAAATLTQFPSDANAAAFGTSAQAAINAERAIQNAGNTAALAAIEVMSATAVLASYSK